MNLSRGAPLVALALGCAIVLASTGAGSTSTDAGAELADARAVASIAEAVAQAHERADAQADPRAAASELEAALALDFPPGEDSRQLRADLHARRSQLLLKVDGKDALAAARAGLKEEAAQPETALTAQLRLREGEALEAIGDDGAAVDAYSTVIAIARRLLAAKGNP